MSVAALPTDSVGKIPDTVNKNADSDLAVISIVLSTVAADGPRVITVGKSLL